MYVVYSQLWVITVFLFSIRKVCIEQMVNNFPYFAVIFSLLPSSFQFGITYNTKIRSGFIQCTSDIEYNVHENYRNLIQLIQKKNYYKPFDFFFFFFFCFFYQFNFSLEAQFESIHKSYDTQKSSHTYATNNNKKPHTN